MEQHRVGTREEWEVAREKLLEREKDLTNLSDELARERRKLPWVPIEKEYSFDTDTGARTLAELFDGRTQLVIYHHMFGPHYQAGCPTCSTIADTVDGIFVHLASRDVTLICASGAPLEKIQPYKRRMGWSFDWVSTYEGAFNFDLGFSHTDEEVQSFVHDVPPIVDTPAAMCGTDRAGYLTEEPGMSVFALDDGIVHQTYSARNRGAEPLMAYYGVLDRAPHGRNEGEPFEFWFRRHDEYDQAGPS
jgi:predicted dithiol-disulfide oxidoreductase (DUF899 family)